MNCIQLLSSQRKHRFHIVSCLRTRLEESVYFVLLLELNRPLPGHLPVILQIGLVAYKIEQDVRVGMLFGLFEPVYYIQEGVISGHIIGQKHAMGASVKDSGDGSEGLLARSVPDLQFHYLAVNLDHEGSELNPDCNIVFLFEIIVHDS